MRVDRDGLDQLVAGRAVGQFLAKQPPHGVDDLLAAAVSDREVDMKAAAVAVGRLDGVAQPPRRLLADQLEVADRAHAPPVGGCADLLDDVGDDFDQCRQFVHVALQVLGGQQVDGGHLDAGFLAPAQHLGDFAGAHPVAVADVIVTSITRPPAVTIAQHRDVPGQFGFGPRQFLAQPHLVEPVRRFLETRGNDVHEDPDYCDVREPPWH